MRRRPAACGSGNWRSEEHTSELQSLRHLVCRLLLSAPAIYTLSLHDALPILDKEGALTVFRLTTQGEEVVVRLPTHGRPPFKGLWMSPDGRFVVYGYSAANAQASGGVRIWQLEIGRAHV